MEFPSAARRLLCAGGVVSRSRASRSPCRHRPRNRDGNGTGSGLQPRGAPDPRRELLPLSRAGRRSAAGGAAPRHARPRQGRRVGRRIVATDRNDVMPPPAHRKGADRRRRSTRCVGGSRAEPGTSPTGRSLPPVRPALPSAANEQRPTRSTASCGRACRRSDCAPSPAGGPADARAPRLSRPDRPAADAGAGRRVRARPCAATPTSGSSTRCWQSPHYGERWARRWLDLARYADTNGYEKDRAAQHLALPRLGHPRAQRRHAVRPVHDRAARRRHAARTPTPRPAHRHRIPPQHDAQRGGRHRPARVPLPRDDRPRRHDRHRLARPHDSAAPSATRTSTTRSRTASTTA